MMSMIIEKLNNIRKPNRLPRTSAIRNTTLILVAGLVLGIFSKWLDNLALDSVIWWHRLLEALDLGIFFSDIAIWLLAALMIAVFSKSALRAALNVFVFFAGMCAAYHLCTIVFSGFNPLSYMMVWYCITALSPLPAILCWYAKGSDAAALILDIGIIAVFALSCFSIGLFYISSKGLLYLLVFAGAVFVLYRNPKQAVVSVLIGILLAFLLSPIWPYH